MQGTITLKPWSTHSPPTTVIPAVGELPRAVGGKHKLLITMLYSKQFQAEVTPTQQTLPGTDVIDPLHHHSHFTNKMYPQKNVSTEPGSNPTLHNQGEQIIMRRLRGGVDRRPLRPDPNSLPLVSGEIGAHYSVSDVSSVLKSAACRRAWDVTRRCK